MRHSLIIGAVLLASLVALLFHFEAQAGILDFIGDIGSSVAEASWKIIAIKALEGSLLTIIFGLTVFGLIVCVVAVYTIANGFTGLASKAMKDDKITPTEKWTLGAAGFLYTIGLSLVGWLAFFLITVAESIR